jgi:hypothetical protein
MQKPKWAYIIQYSIFIQHGHEQETWAPNMGFMWCLFGYNKWSNSNVPGASSTRSYSCRCIALLLASLQKIQMTASNPPVGSALPKESKETLKTVLWQGLVVICSGARGHPLWLEILFVGLKTYVLVLQTLGDPQTEQLDGWTVRTDVTAMWILKLSLGWGMIMDDRIITYLVVWWFHDFIQTSLAYNQSTSR